MNTAMIISNEFKAELNKILNAIRGEVHVQAYHILPAFMVLERINENVKYLQKPTIYIRNFEKTSDIVSMSNTPDKDSVIKAFDILCRGLRNLKTSTVRSVFGWLDNMNFGRMSHEEFGAHYKFVLSKIIDLNRPDFGLFYIPDELSELVTSLYEVKNKARIYNPFAGLASFGTQLREDVLYVGQEINPRTWALGILNLLAQNRLQDSVLDLRDSIHYWIENERFDLIYSFPPMMMKTDDYFRLYTNDKFVDSAVVQRAVHFLHEEGKAVVVVPTSFLSRSSNRNLRSFLVEEGVLEYVIEFPGGLLQNTNISFSVLVN